MLRSLLIHILTKFRLQDKITGNSCVYYDKWYQSNSTTTIFGYFSEILIVCLKTQQQMWPNATQNLNYNNQNSRKEQTNANSMESPQAIAHLNYLNNNIQH